MQEGPCTACTSADGDVTWHPAVQGFLSAQLSFPQLIGFGLSLFAKSTNAARLNLLVKGLPGLLVMLARLTGTVGYDVRTGREADKWDAARKKDAQQEELKAPAP